MTGLPATVPHRVIGRQVHVDVPLCLGGAGRETAVAVQFLRECQSQRFRTHWEIAYEDRARCDDPLDTYDAPYVRMLHHLHHPSNGSTNQVS